ncbi:cupin domain-containing protein [Haloferax sp. MBLA0076]|uniref:Cupin domain-containing protein n=1 Tax=Haloferax litoreum TaxID=2666140 RepID=A0A6A8GIB2_9EURY|nr:MULTISPECIES: cupin domain-containing protein [Haloferax]KAB1193955.1 cupin domain-containing protein [Haloferax sp. CBA1148]MRX22501.1 cupin domain-containing protein [Haloferax litoreum]
MKVAKDAVPTRIDSPVAVARQQPDFGDTTGYGTLGAEYFTLAQGTDITPLLKGLKDDLCQAPHWGYVVSGALTVTYSDGSNEADETGDLFYWPPGHTVRADEDTDFVLFSPQHEHGEVMDQIQRNMEQSS